MEKRLLDYDPLTGVAEWFHYDHSDDTFYTQSVQDPTALFEANRASFNETSSARSSWGDKIDKRTHVASLDLVTYARLRKEGIIGDPARFAKWLNDPDNAMFRTRPGHIGAGPR